MRVLLNVRGPSLIHFNVSLFSCRDGPEWARQRGYIQKLMMHPLAATRYLHWQQPVAQDFADYLGNKREEDNLVPNLYEDLFKYTMECECMGTFHVTLCNGM